MEIKTSVSEIVTLFKEILKWIIARQFWDKALIFAIELRRKEDL